MKRNKRRIVRRTDQRAGCACTCESLETRRLLSTYVINGTAAADSWTISADAGQITVNGATSSVPSLTDVQVNGLDGDDTLFVTHTSVPVGNTPSA